MIDYGKLRKWQSGEIQQEYGPRDTILYAMGVGIGADPSLDNQRRFIYEKDLVALPSMCAVLASPGSWMRDPALGIDFLRMVHGEQALQMHTPLPPTGSVSGVTRITHAVDKGEGKGALVYVEKELRDTTSGRLIATVRQGLFCRGDGGFSKSDGRSDPAPAGPPAVPERSPDRTLDLRIRADAAALYRLSGDLNPLHIDPQIAKKAGFAKPILHGLATYGMACHGLVGLFLGYDPTQLRSFSARFTAPIYPEETLRLECWTIDGEVAFQARCLERDIVVLANGRMAR
jgi:acyl dehydratase